MKRHTSLLSLLLVVSSIPLVTSCSSVSKKQDPTPSAAVGNQKPKGNSVKAEELDEYSTVLVSDPLEPVNRGTFWLNDGVYTIVFRPISKTYETIVPKPVRKGLDNAFENVRFPVRFVNNALQGNFKRAKQELEKFLVNSTVGLGGFVRQSDRIPSLADVPAADTGQTFAKWGFRHGPYIVLPILGPSSLRDGIGYAGDSALNPVSWITILYGGPAWTVVFPSTNTVRSLPHSLRTYDAATKNALDRYIAARTAFIQYRNEVALK